MQGAAHTRLEGPACVPVRWWLGDWCITSRRVLRRRADGVECVADEALDGLRLARRLIYRGIGPVGRAIILDASVALLPAWGAEGTKSDAGNPKRTLHLIGRS